MVKFNDKFCFRRVESQHIGRHLFRDYGIASIFGTVYLCLGLGFEIVVFDHHSKTGLKQLTVSAIYILRNVCELTT